jgi:hypothetical protein
MRRRTIVQKGEEGADLFLYCHIDPAKVAARAKGLARGAMVVERWGEGTRAYRPLLEVYGGFAAWVASVAVECEKDSFGHIALTTFSAGSQVAKEVCKGDAWPDAIVMLDGLYGDKPPGSRPGDGKVVLDEGLSAIATYATAAARGERIMVILHSAIPTPYASSSECAAAVQQKVEEALGGAPLSPDPTASPEALGAFTEAVSAGGLHIVGFPGTSGAEHTREGELYEACFRLWLPWASG